MTINLKPDETRGLRLLANEADPHRVRFWRVVVSCDGLTLVPEHEPEAEIERTQASWHDMHDMMHTRPALIEEIETLQQELRDLRWETARERTRWRRLQGLVAGKQAQLDAMGEPTVLPFARGGGR